MKQIIQIVPRLPPAINGLGDYALKLACQLFQDFEIQTHFIVCDPKWNGTEKVEGFSINRISDRSLYIALSILYLPFCINYKTITYLINPIY